jgi:hypothetical protein
MSGCPAHVLAGKSARHDEEGVFVIGGQLSEDG